MSWIITGKEAGSLGLLDQYGDAAAAYSLRNLSLYNTDPVVRVRRNNDNAEQDFTATEVSDGTLAAWVGAGNDGFVPTWYDQSGSGNDASAATDVNQPRIVIGGALVTENSTPAISYSDDLLTANFPLANTSNYFITTVYRIDTSQDPNVRYFALNLASSSINLQLGHNNSDGRYFNRVNNSTTLSANTYTVFGSVNLLTWSASAGALAFSRNGATDAFNQAGPPNANSGIGDGLSIFKGYDLNSYYAKTGHIQELIIYPSDQSSNRVGIETNINAHYSIY